MQLTGDLSKVSLANLLQLVRNGELTGKISLLQGVKTATIYLDRGQVIHVEHDSTQGREALMELFLWGSGTFSFLEENVSDVPRSLLPSRHQEHTMERLVRDGIGYLEQKKYLDQMQIGGQTILIPTDMALQPQTWLPPGRSAIYRIVEPILTRIDGRRTLADALGDANLTRRAFVAGVYNLLAGGFALVREPEPDFDEYGERVNLPAWVVARLKQDNPDLSQSIVDMVIWVDRVKCWMYQVDADFNRILEAVNLEEEVESPEEDFFAQLEHGEFESEEPFFGESLIPEVATAPSAPVLPPAVQSPAPAERYSRSTAPGSGTEGVDTRTGALPAPVASVAEQSESAAGIGVGSSNQSASQSKPVLEAASAAPSPQDDRPAKTGRAKKSREEQAGVVSAAGSDGLGGKNASQPSIEF